MQDKSVIGVDLGGTNVRVGRVLDYQIANMYSQRITSNGTEQQVIDDVIYSIRQIFDSSVAGIGIGVPSVVDVDKGIVYDVQNIPSWKEVKLKEILENEFHVPVYINNDANCFVVGEKYFGAAKLFDHIVGLIIGTGFGSGIFFDNKLYQGANCGAGEFGMIPYKDGIYENYCSGQFFSRYFNTTGEEVHNKAANGDKTSLDILNEFGIHIGNAISTIIYSVDPEIIILGGSLSQAYDYFKSSMYSIIEKIPYRISVDKVKIEVSNLSQVAILGAAALYYEFRGMEEVQDYNISFEGEGNELNNL